MRHEPRENDPESAFEGRTLSVHGTLLSKILNAQKHGAVGILFVTDPMNHKDLTPAAAGGTNWPSLRKERMKDDEDYRFMSFSPQMRIVGDDFGVEIPAMAVDGKLADFLLVEKSLIGIQEEIDKKVSEVMEPPVCVEDTCGLTRAFALLHHYKLTDLPVVDAENCLVGIASRVDVGTALLKKWEIVSGD